MKYVNFHHKPISMFVIIAFSIMLVFWANQTPAAPSNSAPEKSSAATLENSKGEGTGFIEQEESAPAIKKGKKFPWLIVALVVVAGGAAVYFLVLKKKKYTLTVTVGEGVTGTPAAGTSTNEKGTVVNYNYSLQSGYNDLSVTLDGAPVAASGTVTMNANHTLEAKATKTFVLTVSKGAHVTGTPNSGTYSYARGTNVPYSYAPESGYSGLEVKIDGAAAATSGAISMNDNHSLSAALQGANLVVNSTPAGARIYFDYVDTGHTTPYSFFFPTAQSGLNVYVRAAACGYQEYHQTVSVNVGQTVTINPTLAIGIREDFGIPAATCWSPYYTTGWSIFAATYRYTGAPSGGSPNVFVRSFSGDYTVSSEMNRIKGSTASANAIFLGTSSSKTSAYGYFFAYYGAGYYRIYRFHPYNLVGWTGTYTLIKNSTSSAIQAGLNKWNTLKIVKVGSNYTFYINNINLHSFTDSTYNPTYLSLVFHCGGMTTETRTDYVYLLPNS